MSTIKQDYYEQLSPLVYAITGIEVKQLKISIKCVSIMEIYL